MADEKDTVQDDLDDKDPQDQADDQADDQQDDIDADADDQQDEPDHADPGDEDPEPQRQSRGSERIRRQAELNRQERERAEAAERRAAEAERRAIAAEAAAAARENARTDAEERAAMDAMSNDERTTYLMAKELKALKQTVGSTQLIGADARDSAKFSSYLARNPRFEKYADRVEQIVGDAIGKGQFISRDLVLNQLIATDVRNGKTNDVQRTAAKKRVENARGRTTTTRSDAGRRSGGKESHVARMEREDILI